MATYSFTYERYESANALTAADAALLKQAQTAAKQAYAPYSRFNVGAAALLENGEVVSGSNQENASFPAGICAERVLLSAIASLYPAMPVKTMALSYEYAAGAADHPISPCGICRQSLQEYEQRTKQPIRLIMAGQTGEVWILPHTGLLLPLAFTSKELGA